MVDEVVKLCPLFYYYRNFMSEQHPLKPFLPSNAKLLMLGSFPPQKKRWCMDFFYPNWSNDFWRIIGTVFFDDKTHFTVPDAKRFDKDAITAFLAQKGIALYDTACEVIRLKDNASDKYLEVVKYSDIKGMLETMPQCRAIATTGEKATAALCDMCGHQCPPIGTAIEMECAHRSLQHWRMPSSSRAYPLPLDKKADIYRRMFSQCGLL